MYVDWFISLMGGPRSGLGVPRGGGSTPRGARSGSGERTLHTCTQTEVFFWLCVFGICSTLRYHCAYFAYVYANGADFEVLCFFVFFVICVLCTRVRKRS